LVPGLPHRPPARRAPALEPRFAARLGRRRRLGRGRDDRGGPTRLPVLTPCPPLRSGEGGLRAFPLSRREGGPGGEARNGVGGPVVARLEDPDADVRHEAIDLLEHLHARSAASAIARLIHDPSPDVRHSVVSTLGNLGAQSAAAAITEALSDANADVRQAALGALNDLKAPIAEATLFNLMKDPSADVRQRAAELAGERSLVAAIPQLRRLIDDPRGDVREAATQALGHIADPAARQAL